MAITWTYGGWRREVGATAQRAMLVLHIEEVEQRLAGFSGQGAMQNRAERYQLDEYLKGLESKLADYDRNLGLDLAADIDPFVSVRPTQDEPR